ncbi:MAG: hypothetical protein RPU13_16380 [Candidatus Sedimenticola sp. (ex Thyasira tokunagai)]
MEVLPKRFEKYGLEIHPEKSRLLSFGKPTPGKEVTRGDNTFDFRGFTNCRARTRRGYWVIKRKTARKKVRKTVQALWTWSRNNRHQDLKKQYRILCSKLRGHYQYFGVRCNMRAMEVVLHHARRGWRFWLNRRSSKKTLTWEKYEKLMESMPLPRPKIIHNV